MKAMSDSNNIPNQESALAVSLTVGQLQVLIRDEVENALGQNGHGKELLTAEDLAERLKVPLSWVYEQSRQDNIPTHRLGRYIRFDLQEVLASQKKDHQTS